MEDKIEEIELSITEKIPSEKQIKRILEDEMECIQFLQDKGIIFKSQKCWQCGNEMKQKEKMWNCSRRDCRRTQSMLTHSFFENHRLPLNEIFRIYYLWLIKVPMTSIHIMTGHSTQTIANNINNIRQLVESQINDTHEKIGGKDIIVEIDESLFGRTKYHRGKPVQGQWVIGGVERTPERKIFVKTIDKRNESTLFDIIKENVHEGSIIYTDQWKGYHNLSEKLDYQHGTVNHSKYFKDPETGIHTNTIEGNWNGIKILTPSRNRAQDKLQPFLSEYVWRRQNINNPWEGFLQSLKSYLLVEAEDKPLMENDETN